MLTKNTVPSSRTYSNPVAGVVLPSRSAPSD